ncbi:hypothetical protein LCGC14_1806700 [marine sediment metagenome]|uniref:Nuclease associated modular domain-containing protein n=1 Tax=marine sediment metagenome TaxID=412755 RepID=A0A0F9GMU0_9ZZZZ
MTADPESKPRLTRFYLLADPFTGLPRYIGKTWDTLEHRFGSHIRVALSGEYHNHKDCWIRRTLRKGKKPRIKLIAERLCVDWQSLEQHYIRVFRSLGASLVNGNHGGGGSSAGRKLSEEHKRKISESCKGQKRSEETKQKLSESKLGNTIWAGRKHTNETRRKMSRSQKGRIFSNEHRQNVSKAKRGKKLSEEARRNVSAAAMRRLIPWEEAPLRARQRRMKIFHRRLQELVEVRNGIT